jgi:hypothetical protein
MPTGLTVALRLLYVFLFLCLVGLSLVQPAAHWLSTNFGFWTMIAGLAGYAGIVGGAIALINKINRDWPSFELPSAKSAPMWDIEEPEIYVEQSVNYADNRPPGQGKTASSPEGRTDPPASG